MTTPPGKPEPEIYRAEVSVGLAGLRLDQALARLFPDFSRSRLQDWIKAGQVQVDGAPRRARDKVVAGEQVRLEARIEEQVPCRPQAIALNIVHEDQYLLVIDKPAGLVVHPAVGNRDGTLQNALLHHAPQLIELPRAGIVHRLDKDTTGLMVVAKTQAAHKRLVESLQAREVKREYRALVLGRLVAGGSVEEPIGRHPTQRTRMAVHPLGKPAVSHYRLSARYRAHTLLQVNLETGRTHQIRVHMAHIRHPVFGDPTYGGRLRLPAGASEALIQAMRAFRRQALHAFRLGFEHPATGEVVSWEAPLPADFAGLLGLLADDAERLADG